MFISVKPFDALFYHEESMRVFSQENIIGKILADNYFSHVPLSLDNFILGLSKNEHSDVASDAA